MSNIMYGGTKEEMQRLLKDAEKLTGKKFDLSSYADIVEAIHAVQENMGIAGTTAKEASTTISGSINSMKSAWTNFLTGMADPKADLDALTDNLVDSVVTVANNLLPVVKRTIPKLAAGLKKIAGNLFDEVVKSFPILKPIADFIKGITDKLKTLSSDGKKVSALKSTFESIKTSVSDLAAMLGKAVDAVIDFATSTGFLTFVQKVFDGISKAIGWVKDNLSWLKEIAIAVGGAFVIFATGVKLVSGAFKVYNAIQKTFSTIQKIATAAQWGANSALAACPLTWIVVGIIAVIAVIILLVRNWDKVKEVAVKVWNKIKEIWGKLASWFKENVIEPLVKFFTELWAKIKEIAQGIWQSITGVFSKIGSWVYENVIQPVVSFFKGLGTALFVIVAGIVGLICQLFLKIGAWVNEKVIQPVVKFFTELWNKLKEIVTNIVNSIKAVWGVIAGWVNSKIIQPVIRYYTNLWNKIKAVVGKVWDVICSVWGKISGWVNSKVIIPITNFFKGLWKGIKNIAGNIKTAIVNAFQEAWDKVTGVWGGIKDFFKGIWNGLKDTGSALKEALVSVWKSAVKAIAKPVNKLIGGANWVLERLGSDKIIAEWQPYKRGTKGHPGGNAIVNDGLGAELVQMPNGLTFIPKGRNVGIPNAPAGMKVLDAERTAQLMGRRSPTFNYAGGIGDWDIWDFFDNAKGLVGKVVDKFVSYDGMAGYALNVGKAIITKATGTMKSWIAKLFEKSGGKSLADYDPAKGVNQWKSTVAKALNMEGLHSAANIKRTLFQMETESGGNPRAINNWDSNAKKGTPSKGLMQVIDPTFKAYARKGFASNIYDPLSNILASVRYAVARYGTLEKAYRGVGYADGIGFARLPAYSPSSAVPVSRSSSNTNNYSPSFTLNMSGTVDRTTERTIKRWVKEALDETFDSMSRTSPRLTEV